MTYSWTDLEELYQNGTFCPDGWTSVSSTTDGRWRMCCYTAPVGGSIAEVGLLEHLNHPERKQARLAMLSGDNEYLDQICRKCYYQAEHGLEQRRSRMMDNYRYDERAQAGLLATMNSMLPDGSIDVSYIHHLDIKFIGNQCNLKCYTCQPKNSSSLGVEAKAMGDLPADYRPVQIPLSEISIPISDKFWEDFRAIMPYLRIINFTGGEPFMMNGYWDMIDLAIETGAAANMELHLSSNVSAIKWDRGNIMDCFNAFAGVRLQASVDAYGGYNDYIRYPSKYQDLIDNTLRIRDERPDIEILVTSVVSALSVKSVPQMNAHMQSLGLTHRFSNILESPVYQRVEWLPSDVKQQYLDQEDMQAEQFAGIRTLLSKPADEKRHAMLVNRCKSLDRHRGTDAQSLWPEFQW